MEDVRLDDDDTDNESDVELHLKVHIDNNNENSNHTSKIIEIKPLVSAVSSSDDLELLSIDDTEDNNHSNQNYKKCVHKSDQSHSDSDTNVDTDQSDDDDDEIRKTIMVDNGNNGPYSKPWYKKWKNWMKLNCIFILLAFAIAALSQPKLIWKLMQSFLEWMETHLTDGSFALIGIYIICDLLMVPCVLFVMGSGFVYCHVLGTFEGLIVATLVMFTAEFIASIIAFLCARYLLRKTIKKLAAKYPKFTLIDLAVKKNGFKVTLLFRMSPVTPYNLFNYFMGLTGMKLLDYIKASVGIFPNFFMFCLIGGSLHHIYELSHMDLTENLPLLVATVFGFSVAIIGIAYGTRMIRRELAKISCQLKAEKDILSSSEDMPLTEANVSQFDDIASIDLDAEMSQLSLVD